MTGRGIDQILPNPGDPRLYEAYVDSAMTYVELAQMANGSIPIPADFSYVWGEALAELQRQQPDARIINLETAVTKSENPVFKGINYKMTPENFPCVSAAKIDCCVLANNHVLDWGQSGLLETLQSLEEANVKTVGAGRDKSRAAEPCVLTIEGKGRVVIFAFGTETSGVPRSWAATEDQPGVNVLPDLSSATIGDIARQVKEVKQPGDVILLSLHWGPNWGYEIPKEEYQFAHRLIDEASVDIIHGHSSHHVKAIEVYNKKLIFYGCGDFLTDYEGIRGRETFRDDLVLMYLPTIRISDGELLNLTLVPFQIKNFRLVRPSHTDMEWLQRILIREGERFNTQVSLKTDNSLALEWH